MVYSRETYAAVRMWGGGRRPIRKSEDGLSHSHASGSGDVMPRASRPSVLLWLPEVYYELVPGVLDQWFCERSKACLVAARLALTVLKK